jgi:hypothetical protein
MRYQVISYGHGITYERGSYEDREEAVDKALGLAIARRKAKDTVDVWVWDQNEDRRVYLARITSFGDLEEERPRGIGGIG